MGHNEEKKTINEMAIEYAKQAYENRKRNNNLMHSLKSAENDWLMGYMARDQEVARMREVISLLEPIVRTAKEETGQQLLIGAYQAMMRQVSDGNVEMYPRREMLELVMVDGHARGIIVRNLITGELEAHHADAVVLATGGYGNVFYLSTNAKASNTSAIWRAHKKGALFANPCYTQIHPTCIPVSGDHQSKLTLMSESLRNDGRCW